MLVYLKPFKEHLYPVSAADEAETAGAGYCGRERATSHAPHGSKDDRTIDFEQLGEAGAHGEYYRQSVASAQSARHYLPGFITYPKGWGPASALAAVQMMRDPLPRASGLAQIGLWVSLFLMAIRHRPC